MCQEGRGSLSTISELLTQIVTIFQIFTLDYFYKHSTSEPVGLFCREANTVAHPTRAAMPMLCKIRKISYQSTKSYAFVSR